MKKTLVSALTTALVVGAASTTFAAANPFADVPADHWAYDAVAQLAQDGVINGYAVDGTFKGDQNMSRYEMAQIVAKAMARVDASNNNQKALLDKLAAEFSDELANLGVRVANLEAKVDNVKWEGRIRYDWSNFNYASQKGHRQSEDNTLKLRLEPSMTINENWTGHARIDADINPDDNAGKDGKFGLEYAYAEGQYGKFDIKLGRFGSNSDASYGMVMDDTPMTGAEAIYAPTENWKLKVTGSRIAADDMALNADGTRSHGPNVALGREGKASGATYWAAEVGYANDKFEAGVGYHEVRGTNFQFTNADRVKIADVGLGYKFDKNVKLTGTYARATKSAVLNDIGAGKDAYKINLAYKGADEKDAGSWGAWVEYRKYSPLAAFQAGGDLKKGADGYFSVKGWEIGANYTWAKNIITTVKYFNGKDLLAGAGQDDKARGIWTRTDFVF